MGACLSTWSQASRPRVAIEEHNAKFYSAKRIWLWIQSLEPLAIKDTVSASTETTLVQASMDKLILNDIVPLKSHQVLGYPTAKHPALRTPQEKKDSVISSEPNFRKENCFLNDSNQNPMRISQHRALKHCKSTGPNSMLSEAFSNHFVKILLEYDAEIAKQKEAAEELRIAVDIRLMERDELLFELDAMRVLNTELEQQAERLASKHATSLPLRRLSVRTQSKANCARSSIYSMQQQRRCCASLKENQRGSKAITYQQLVEVLETTESDLLATQRKLATWQRLRESRISRSSSLYSAPPLQMSISAFACASSTSIPYDGFYTSLSLQQRFLDHSSPNVTTVV